MRDETCNLASETSSSKDSPIVEVIVKLKDQESKRSSERTSSFKITTSGSSPKSMVSGPLATQPSLTNGGGGGNNSNTSSNSKQAMSAMTGNSMVSPLVRPGPSEIQYKNMRFLIMDRPTQSTLPSFTEELKKRNVKAVVRVCESAYKVEPLQQDGIRVIDMQFDDGTPPPPDIVEGWFELLRSQFREEPNACVAVHCVAGLGRAPVLVALALIELGMSCDDAVELIREKRRGAINAKQLSYLASYRPKTRLRIKGHPQNKACCLQ